MQRHTYYFGFAQHTFKDRLYKHKNSFKSDRNSTEFSNFMRSKKKERANVNLDYSILGKAKPYSPATKKNECCALHRNITFSLQRIC